MSKKADKDSAIQGNDRALERRIQELEKTVQDQDEMRASMLAMLEDLEENRQAIQKAKQEWSDAFDALTDPIFLHDEEFRIVRANLAYAKHAGIPIQDAIGKPYWEVFPKHEGPLPSCTRSLREEAAEEEEITLETGETFTSRVFAIRDREGAYVHSIHVLEDITERKQIQARLREREAYLRSIYEAEPECVKLMDTQGRLLDMNPAGLAMFEVESLDDIINKPLKSFIVDKDRQAFTQFTKQILKGESSSLVFEIEGIKGTHRFMDSHAVPLMDEHGGIFAVLAVMRDVTERRQTAQALRESEERFRAVSISARDAILMVDDKEQITLWNEAARRMFGYSWQEVEGQVLHKLIIPERLREDHLKGFKTFSETGVGPVIGQVLELPALRRDGSEFYAEIAISGVKLAGQWHAVGLVRDITERKQAEEALKESEEKFRTIFDNALDGILVVDVERKMFFTGNTMICRMLGYTLEEVLQLSVEDIHPAKDLHHIVKLFEKQVRGEIGLAENLPVKRKDGSIFYADINSSPITLGGKTYLIGIFRDITERRQADDNLRASEERYRNYIELTGQLGWTTNAAGEVEADIPAWRRYTGQSEEEITGWGWIKALHPDDREAAAAIWKQAVATQSPYEVEYRVRRHDGTYRSFMARGVAVIDDNGVLREWVGTCIDITERKQAEQILARTNRMLKTLRASNEALIHATDETALLQEACRIIVEVGGYRLAWVGYAEDDEARSVRPVAWEGFEKGYLQSLKITWSDTVHGSGPTGTAIRERRLVIARDILTDPSFVPWREEAKSRGYASSIALPCAVNGQVLGALNVYAAEPDAFSEEEVKLLTELANDLTYGIMTLRTRTERKRLQMAHRDSTEQLKQALLGTIQAVALTVEKRDPYTAGHQRRVAELSVAIAAEMGLPAERIEGIQLGAIIHDIGKIYIPAEILNRPGRLTDAEFEMIKSHPQVGYDIIKGVNFPWPVGEMILQHHERRDGSGYPQGLKDGEITLEARIMAVADVVEAMASHRPYRPGLSIEVALEEIERGKDRHYEPDAVHVCIKLFHDQGFQFT